MSPAVVIHVHGSWPEHGTADVDYSGGDLPAGFPHAQHAELLARGGAGRGGALDPYRVARDFPQRWSAYIRGRHRDLSEVCRAFGVCERTARKWWTGETGANARQLVMAWRRDPEGVTRDLLAA